MHHPSIALHRPASVPTFWGMEIAETLGALKRLGTEQNRYIYRRHGAQGEIFGVSFANLEGLRKQIKRDHALAGALWDTGNVDARTLAPMVADPKAATLEQLERWAGDIDYHIHADTLVKHVVAKSPHKKTLLERWTRDEREYVGRCGWQLLARLATKGAGPLTDDDLAGHLETIEARIHDAPNRTREAMNGALIAIGLTNEALETLAIAAAERIGEVEIDHGETSCKTPDAIAYIAKTKAHRAKMAARKGG